ncbi:MAG: DinB family protein [Chloroflexota bacterium]
MNLTLLLDLDDTLLTNDMDIFLPAYLKALAGRLASHVAPERMIKALLNATGQMVRNVSPTRTLEETFDAAFYPALGLEKEAMHPVIEDFYAQEYPHLRALTRPHSQAAALVEKALQMGCRVAVATNPLFPRTAIEQRIAWAGLAHYPFALIPSYETFHFAKPNPAFVSEFLAQMGWPEGPVLMVGNDLENDYRSAHGAGIAMYWIQPDEVVSTPHLPEHRGSLADLLTWLDGIIPERIQPRLSTPGARMASLRATPAALGSLTRALPGSAWERRPHPKGWSLIEIACHLRDAESEVNLPRLQKIVQNDAPFLAGIDTDAWIVERQYAQQDGPAALQAFIEARLETISLLESLPAEAWQRPARHAILGPTTLLELVGVLDRHDHLHIRDVKTIVAPLP